MKSISTLFTAFLILSAIYLLSFTPSTNYSAAEALKTVKKEFDQGLIELETAIARYDEAARQFHEDSNQVAHLQAAHLHTRQSFKSIEYLLEYNDREAVKKYLNGPPLLSLEPKVPEVRIIEPVGLQVLDELVFGEQPYEERAAILDLCRQLKKDYQTIKAYQSGIQLQHRYIFEAIRYELIRIFALGLTGFDTPASGQAIAEAQLAMAGLQSAYQAYHPLVKNQDKTLADKVDNLFQAALTYLETHPDFDGFDRLFFLKEYVNPLYAGVLQAQLSIAIEGPDEVDLLSQAVNYSADNIFAENFLDDEFFANLGEKKNLKKRVELGRLLFFDPILSHNNQGACATCHDPKKAFSDGADKSPALHGGGKIDRNAPGLINSVFAERYFYDLREPQLERQIKHVVLSGQEFNTDFLKIIEKLEQSETYRHLFAEAYPEFPQYQLSRWSISDAIACYISDLQAFSSPVDRYIRGEADTLSEAAMRGFNLFMGKAACGTCHFAPTFAGLVPPHYQESESEVLGVPRYKSHSPAEIDADPGRINSGRPQDEAAFLRHSFKTTTTRNVALTAPYMHNGVYDHLEEVIDFYNKGGGIGLGLDVPYQTLPDTPLELQEQEIQDLIVFMQMLSDTTGTTAVPKKLPLFEHQPEWNKRVLGGSY
ncbi:MAG TPA: cytochrome c peroxidase [Saprospiraceae bacterium]|nr:cytochrome c peroxidase [Saprospiraceae bacterium]HMQ85561.1 cytochrome c peroxidase [Saprospiraceae bacterium]